MQETNTLEAKKQAATRFLELVVARRIDEAYEKYVDMTGKHHNPYHVAGFPALKQGMIEAHTKFPDTQLKIKQVIAEGDRVAVHSDINVQPGEPSGPVVHLFRFVNDKIVEIWDVFQPAPADSPNSDGAF